MKRWEKAVANKWASSATHAFLLHLNISDQVWNEKENCFESLTEHLSSSTILADACFVAIYNRADGIYFRSEEEEKRFLEFYKLLHPDVNSKRENIAEIIFYENRRKLFYAL